MKNIPLLSAICIFLLVFFLLSEFDTVYAGWEKVLIDTETSTPFFPAVADIEEDGDIDILVSTYGRILWYEAPGWIKHTIDYDFGFIKAVDLNDDSKVDIVAANSFADEVVWYESPSWIRHVIGTDLSGTVGIEVVDLDDDDDYDVIATERGGNRIVWYEAPNWTEHTITTDFDNGWLLKAADMDSDNDIDIVVCSEIAGVVMWYEAPAWTAHTIDAHQSEAWGIDVGDIVGDDDIDVVVGGHGSGQVALYENDNQSWIKHIVDPDLDCAAGVLLSDLNNDNDLDIVACAQVSNVVVWYESPSWTKHVIDNSLAGASGLCGTDFDGDNLIDIVACGKDVGHTVLNMQTMVVSPDNSVMEIPRSFQLRQNYPNPFNASTSIKFDLPQSEHITLKIFNILGNEINTLIDGYKSAGTHEIIFSAHNMATGIYFYKLQAGHITETKKMLLLQ